MTTITHTHATLAEFEAYDAQHPDLRVEWVGGEIVEVPSNPYSSQIAALLIFYLQLYIRNGGRAGHITGEGGGYQVVGERYAPDVAFVAAERQSALPYDGFNPIAPDLAVEVVSPTDSVRHYVTKVSNYLAAGTVVWVIYPASQQVAIHAPTQPVQVLSADDVLTGGDVLPDFSVTVRELFPPMP